jgi:hypothetical protein
MHRPFLLLAIGTAGVVAPLLVRAAATQDRYCYAQEDDLSFIDNAPYDGRFTFFRVRFDPYGQRGFGRRVDRKWDHDAPRAEQHLLQILEEITTLRPKMDCGTIHAFGDPESFKYPIAYVSEPGFWTMSDAELKGVRDFVGKGGFLIFDDFFAEHWYNFDSQWRRAFPDLQLVQLDLTHPVFDSFYRIDNLEMFYRGQGGFRGARAEWYGAYEDNDPSKRLVAVVNYNNDLGDYMEYSDTEFVSIDLSNEAYKIMVNYMIYAMTH